MYNLFWAMLLVFLDLFIRFNGHTIELLPDFLGYYLLKLGLEQVAAESGAFARSKPFAQGMMIYTAVLFVLDIFAVDVYMELISWVLGLLATVANLVIGYWIILGVTDMEARHNWDLDGQRLKSMWLYVAVLQGIAYVCGWIPYVGTVGSIAAFIVGVCFVIVFHKSVKLYQQLK